MKIIGYIFCVAGLSIGMLSGCQKDDSLDTYSGFLKVKVYDDSITDPRNGFTRIASGNNRLFMTFSNGSEFYSIVNGVPVFPPWPDTQWIISDNNGNEVQRGTLPYKYWTGDVIALQDNSFLVAACVTDTSAIQYTHSMKLFHYDQNGVLLSSPSVTFPPSFNFFIYQVKLARSSNGGIMMSLTYSGGGNIISFVGECDVNGIFSWFRIYPLIEFTDFITTGDGGCLHVGRTYDATDAVYKVHVLKTNASGDSVWSRSYAPSLFGAVSRNIIPSGNGGYLFSYYDYQLNSGIFSLAAYVCEIGAMGDSLHAVMINENNSPNENWPVTLLPDAGGGAFSMLNISRVLQAGSSRVNTTYVYMDSQLNLTRKGKFQNETNDFISDACRTSDGDIACFGLIQSYDRGYYRPQLIIFK